MLTQRSISNLEAIFIQLVMSHAIYTVELIAS